jgi:hypothetical protein
MALAGSFSACRSNSSSGWQPVLVGRTGAVPAGLQASGRLHSFLCLLFQDISVTILTFVCYSACTFLPLARIPKLRLATEVKGKEVKDRFHNHSIMGRPTAETGGGTPQNQGLSEFKPLAKERRVGWGVKKPEEPKQQPANSYHELSDFYRREQEQHAGVLVNPIRVPRPLPKKP